MKSNIQETGGVELHVPVEKSSVEVEHKGFNGGGSH
jgi:hypothetical protein